MKIIICEDNLEEGKVTKEILVREKFEVAENIEILSPQEVLIAFEEEIIECDILVMDIEFKDEKFNGIYLTDVINECLPTCQIIYLSNYVDYAPEVYETEHCYFVVKKNADIMLPRAMKKAIELYKESLDKEYIIVTSNGKKHTVSVEDVIYIEKLQRKSIVYTNSVSLEIYQSLRSIVSKCHKLVRCHGSYVVNLQCIEMISKDNIVLTNGVSVPIGRNYQARIKDSFLEYWGKRM